MSNFMAAIEMRFASQAEVDGLCVNTSGKNPEVVTVVVAADAHEVVREVFEELLAHLRARVEERDTELKRGGYYFLGDLYGPYKSDAEPADE